MGVQGSPLRDGRNCKEAEVKTQDAPNETDWWFATAENCFESLVSGHGFRIVERFRHFKGNYIVYDRETARFTVECAPDWNSLSGWLWVGPVGHRTGGLIEEVLGAVDPQTDWLYASDSGPVVRESVKAKMDLWAKGIVTHLPRLEAIA